MTKPEIKHGLTPADITRMRKAQQGLCYLCTEPLPEDPHLMAIDHDHRCCPPKKSCACCRRGLSCHGCNLVIGHARDDVARLRKIADNLEAAMSAVTQRMASKPSQGALFETPGQAPKRLPVRQRAYGVLADVLRVFTDTNAMRWQVVAERLAAEFPNRWGEVTPAVISAQCRALGVPSVTVTVGGRNGKGCRKADLMTSNARTPPLAA